MRNMSFMLTTDQFRSQTKTVTRRLGWKNLKPGVLVMGCEKCQGLKKGESLVRLGKIRIKSVRREPLDLMAKDEQYGNSEAILEGFPDLTGLEFVTMFCREMKVIPETEVTRIEYEYL